MVGINVPIPVPVAYYSFGGWKASLFGDTHMYGPEGVNFYTRGKVVTSRWPDPATVAVDLGFPRTPDLRGDPSDRHRRLRLHAADHRRSQDAQRRPRARLPLLVRPGAHRPAADRPRRGLATSGTTTATGTSTSPRQLVNINIGHQHPQAGRRDPGAGGPALHDRAAASPTTARSEAARLIAELAPGDLDKVFFTNGGAEANEHAMRMARLHTGRHKVLAAYRSYHGATDRRDHPDRRPAALGLRARHRRASCTSAGRYLYRSRVPRRRPRRRSASGRCSTCATRSWSRGRSTVAAIILETVVGTNGDPGAAAGLPRRGARALRRARHRADRRRGDGRASAGAASGSRSTTGASRPT